MELLCSGSSVESMLRRNMTRQSPGLQPSALVTASLRRLVLRPQASCADGGAGWVDPHRSCSSRQTITTITPRVRDRASSISDPWAIGQRERRAAAEGRHVALHNDVRVQAPGGLGGCPVRIASSPRAFSIQSTVCGTQNYNTELAGDDSPRGSPRGGKFRGELLRSSGPKYPHQLHTGACDSSIEYARRRWTMLVTVDTVISQL